MNIDVELVSLVDARETVQCSQYRELNPMSDTCIICSSFIARSMTCIRVGYLAAQCALVLLTDQVH